MEAVVFIGIWVTLLYFSNPRLAIDWDAIKKIPDVVLIYGALYLIFTKWLWRLRIFQGWLIPFPDLQGTWKGTLVSTWIDPSTGVSPGPIAVVLVVRQSFAGLSCVIYTKESSSYSTAASIHADEDSDAKTLSYVYTNTPRVSVRHRSIVHDGAATLRVVTSPELCLEGEYWTNRKSTGEMSLKRATTETADGFSE